MSNPAAARRPDDTAPPLRAATGLVCTECHRRFDEGVGRTSCPDDGAPLVRVADMAAADGDPMLGRVLAERFTILAKLGAGSMGTVYRARQQPIGREVAIKILRSERAVDEVSRARFLREARANSLLTSPNTVTVFDFGQSESGDFYLAMELLEGESLGQRIKRVGRLSVEEAFETARQALRSLAEAHAKGVIHRDLKPDNLFYARMRTNERYEEVVKVLDFGIAKMLHADGELAMNVVETQAGTVFGTPRYMSPEQAQGKKLDARSDLYSLGVILYHMVTGRPPFTDDDAIVVMARHIKTAPRTPIEVAPDAKIPSEVDALIMRILSKDPEKRPADADAMAVELARVREQIVASSGVRSSIADVAPPPGAPPASPPGDPSLSVEVLGTFGAELRPMRWMGPALALVGLAVATILALTIFLAARPAAHRASKLPVTPPVAATALPATTGWTPTTVPDPSPDPTTASSIPTMAATALPHPAADPPPLRPGPGRKPGPGVPAKPPATAPSVGYGYLE